MAPEDRDRNFEKALTRQLRSAASRGSAESTSVKMAACPDAETLAAFHERSLLPEEWDRVNLHVAGCPHCMTLLAQLEATDAIPLEVHSAAESQARTLAAASAAPAAATSAPPRKSARVFRLPGARWHYVVPAGALAAGLLVWVAIHENRPLASSMKQRVQVAENQTPPPASPPLSAPVPKASSELKAKAPEPLTEHSELATRTGTADAGKSTAALDDLAKDKTLIARSDAGAALSEKESNLKKEGAREADAISVQADEARDRKAAGAAVQQNADALVQTQAQNNSQLQNQANSNQARGGPTAPGQTTMNRAAAAKPAPAPSAAAATNATPAARMAPAPAAQVTPAPPPPAPSKSGVAGAAASNYTSSGAMETVSGFANPRLITVPGSSLAWRVGRTGLIEFSRNDGASWTRQSSGVNSDLLTGSAPSDKTCWIVGRAGTILLTTDSGAHWKLLKPPFAEDFGGIRATDMLHATVWNAHNTLNYQTTDGGATWTPVPNP